jgi:glycosyltransferase involved in cell wall biosynthesis
MKIGLFLPNATFDLPGSPEVGGIETFAFTIGEALLDLGHDVVLYGGQPKPGHRHRETRIPLRLYPYIETRSILDWGTRFQRLLQRLHFGWKVHRDWQAQAFDVALIFKPFDWPVAWAWKSVAAGSRPPQVVMGFHGTDWFLGDRLFYRAIDAAYAVSPEVQRLAHKRVGVSPVVIPNPVDTAFFCPSGEEKTSGTLRLVASGRLVGWKGFDVLVEALGLLADGGLDFTCEIAGEGPARPLLAEAIQRLGLGSRVTLRGLLDRPALRDRLRQADLYIAPSVGMEAFSIAAAEAASCGLPLILSDQVGLASHLTAADFIVCPAGNSELLADAVRKAEPRRRADPAWVDRLARHRRVEVLFSPTTVARRILDLVPQL